MNIYRKYFKTIKTACGCCCGCCCFTSKTAVEYNPGLKRRMI